MSDWTATQEDETVPSGPVTRGLDEGHLGSRVSEKAQHATTAATDQAKEYVQREIDSRSGQYGQRLGNTASSLQSAASHLRERGESSAASVLDVAARRIDDIGRYLKDVDGEQLLHDVNDLARQRPWLVLSVGLLAGLGLSRLFKLSDGKGRSHATT